MLVRCQDIIDAQIQYHKMMTPGHNQTPSEKCYQEFAGVVRQFLEQNQNNGKIAKTRQFSSIDIHYSRQIN